nr:inducible metalloproteinase inhibitor protein isoform X1 [Helicoverpa armigera]
MYWLILLSCCVVLCAGYNEGCGPNEELRCVQPCPPEKTCRNRDIQYYCILSIQPCTYKCVCKAGYLRNAAGECVTVDKCEKLCKENEIFTDCKRSCPPDTCLSLVARFKCDPNERCSEGCVCRPGYLRKHPHSPCVPICDCDEMKYSEDCKPITIRSLV